ncbi:unnamed protein product [Ambrosiozyma monospora]|uniref:Unnamed protein product n=1 Tax=Ambrosiozyma monospora TaxID=43982 RepID=A0ACB5SX18_AMBMO|nr:unnamed protein product [Ambrosiozyma monospora]
MLRLITILFAFVQFIQCLPAPSPVTTFDYPAETALNEAKRDSIPSTTSTIDYVNVQRSIASYYALDREVHGHGQYYASAYPSLYSELQSIISEVNDKNTKYYSDAVPDYKLTECMLSFGTLVPGTRIWSYQSDYFDIYSQYTAKGTSYLSTFTKPYTETPSQTSVSTSDPIPSSGPYSDLYMIAKCKALVDDAKAYGGWYNSFLEGYSDQNLVTSLMTSGFVNELAIDTAVPINDQNPFRYTQCSAYIKMIDILPWKERVLATAYSRYESYSAGFTTTISIYGYTTLDPQAAKSTGGSGSHRHHSSGVSKGAIAGIVIGCIVGVVVVALFVWFCCKRSRKSSKGQFSALDKHRSLDTGIEEAPPVSKAAAVPSEKSAKVAPITDKSANAESCTSGNEITKVNPPTYQEALNEKAINP